MMQLDGKVAVITGAGSGIGAAIARLYAREGATLALIDLDADGCEAVARECVELGARTTRHVVDVTNSESIRETMAGISEHFGGIDILVNSAGILDETPFLEMDEATFDRTIAVDLKGVFICARWAAPEMVKRKGGRIINVASQLGIKGGNNLAHYSAAKAGVIGLTKSLALELSPLNILANVIAPGPIVTPLMDGLSPEWKKAKAAELPLGRFGRAEEVAPTALLLASSPGGDLYTGQTLGPNSGDVMP
jgi:3-oxoacyl-[acyl-carrier protein] reductase